VDDEEFIPAEMQRTLLTVITAINAGRDIHAAVGASGPADIRDVSTILRILRLPAVGFRHGEPPDVVLARILDLLEAAADGEELEPPDVTDSRY
jgi:hypothetical protein